MVRRKAATIKSLGSALEDLVEGLGIKGRLDEYAAVTEWEGIVGPQIAKVATATRIDRGTLVVRVNNGPWRNELRLRKEEIVGKLNDALGHRVVKDIRFT
ncbi:MAG: DUF721 domain-containing protein [Bacteroidota bacterium]